MARAEGRSQCPLLSSEEDLGTIQWAVFPTNGVVALNLVWVRREIRCVRSTPCRLHLPPATARGTGQNITSLRRRGPLSVWFDPDRNWHPRKADKRGHPDTFSMSAIHFVSPWRCCSAFHFGRRPGWSSACWKWLAGLDWPMPDYSTLCRWQARIVVQIPYPRIGIGALGRR